MGFLRRSRRADEQTDISSSYASPVDRKTEFGFVTEIPATEPAATAIADDDHESLHRGLKARHITMIAIGGAIGTGLIIGTGSALAKSGPASILISYSLVGFIVFLVMAALGEMAAWLPLASGFTGYATRFCDPALGFAIGYTYWFKYIIVTPNQLTASALVIQFWLPAERVNPGVWITVFLVTIICINYFGGVKVFGELEFVLSSLKIIIIVGIILLSLVLAAGGGPDHDPKGFRYWSDPGAFKPYIAAGAEGKFYGFWASMVNAVFAFLGTELVGVTVGEAQNPRRAIPKAIKLTFFRIVVFYILSVFLLGMIVPYNSDQLAFATKASTSASASPFVVAIQIAGIPTLPSVLNAAILVCVFSAANSDLYIATRTIYGLAKEGNAPRILARTDRNGVPYVALAASSLFALLAYMNVSSAAKTVFGYFVNLVSIFGLLTWISILVTHICFVRARRAQGVPDTALAFVAPFGPAGSYIALGLCIIIALTKNFDVFTGGTFDYKNFITGYLGIPLYLIMVLGYKLLMGKPGVKPATADLFGGKDVIDKEEAEFVARKRAEMELLRAQGKAGHLRLYRFIEFLF